MLPLRIPATLLAISLLLAPAASAQTFHVDRNASGPLHDGLSWCGAFIELHEALALATPGTMIKVADGLYFPDRTGLDDPREATFTITAGITVAGAYAGCGAPDPDARSPLLYVTELSGDFDQDDVNGLFDENAYQVISASTATSLSTLGGLVIVGGVNQGGTGGGIMSLGGRLALVACTLRGNRAWRGGGVYCEGGLLHLIACRFIDNHATGEGGATFNFSAEFAAQTCLFTLNTAVNDGGAIFFDLCESTIIGCSFGANQSQSRGGGIYHYVGVGNTVGNSIFWGNTDFWGSGEDAQLHVNPSNILNIDHSCVQGLTGTHGGTGNIDEDPLFADLPAGDLHLQSGSPCIDTGDNALVSSQLDLDGNLRIANGIVDMGCYESAPPTGLPGTGDLAARILTVRPRPSAGGSSILLQTPHHGEWELAAYSVTGRLIAMIAAGSGQGDTMEISWGKDRPAGLYLLRLSVNGAQQDEGKVLIIGILHGSGSQAAPRRRAGAAQSSASLATRSVV